MSATHATDSTTATAPVLYLAFELGWTSWKLAFTVKPASPEPPPAGWTADAGVVPQGALRRGGLRPRPSRIR